MASAVDYLVLTVVHRTNEDWALMLPLDFPVDELEGATAYCILAGSNGGTLEIPCEMTSAGVIQRADRKIFDGRAGNYSGDLRVVLSGGRDIVTHLFNLELKRGVS